MANNKQQIKRYKNADKKHALNSAYKASLRTAIKHVRTAVEEGNKEEALVRYSKATSLLDGSVTKGIYHRNYANRQKSRLAKLVNSI